MFSDAKMKSKMRSMRVLTLMSMILLHILANFSIHSYPRYEEPNHSNIESPRRYHLGNRHVSGLAGYILQTIFLVFNEKYTP